MTASGTKHAAGFSGSASRPPRCPANAVTCAHGAVIGHKPESRKRSRDIGGTQPLLDGRIARGHGGPDGFSVLVDPTPSRPGRPNHKQTSDASCFPSLFASDLQGEARLAIQDEQGRLDVRHNRFDLDDEHDARRWMKHEDVDRPTFAANAEGDLDFHEPLERSEGSGDLLNENSVVCVEQAVQCLAVPGQMHLQAGGGRARNRLHRPNRYLSGMPQLDPRYRRLRGSSRHGKVDLPPTASSPKRSNLATEADCIHIGECGARLSTAD